MISSITRSYQVSHIDPPLLEAQDNEACFILKYFECDFYSSHSRACTTVAFLHSMTATSLPDILPWAEPTLVFLNSRLDESSDVRAAPRLEALAAEFLERKSSL